ncbi:MAG TPA: hypothetical protein VFQ02_08935 [Nitrospira sp.]|nr:hypothetical protein [Nitrospira sp.]
MKIRRRDGLVENRGHVLLASLMLVIMLSLLSMTALYLVGQDAPGISAMREQSQSQQLADAATELVVSWFHDTSTTPTSIADLLAKRRGDATGALSFFDGEGRSQFTGTLDRPDLLLDAANEGDDRILNEAPSGFSGPLSEAGRLERVKLYAPMEPGLLGTVEVTASTRGSRPAASTIRFQLGAVNLPPVRAAMQTGQGLTASLPEGEVPVLVHWGDTRVMGDMAINRMDDLVVKSTNAPVNGQSYETMGVIEDRWMDYWIGGSLSALQTPGGIVSVPQNVHMRQEPTPGARLDRWDYDLLKKTAQRYGTYYRLDRDGRLHELGSLESDPGRSPSEVLASSTVGQSHGLVFVDTLDGERPRLDNLGTLVVDADYVEALLVVQGHVLVKPSGSGRSVTVLSPPPEGTSASGGRIPVTLPGVHLNGMLYAAGHITVERQTHIFGAVMTSGTVAGGTEPPSLEIWYNFDFSKGLFRGLPVVYRAPSTWQPKY